MVEPVDWRERLEILNSIHKEFAQKRIGETRYRYLLQVYGLRPKEIDTEVELNKPPKSQRKRGKKDGQGNVG